MTYVEIIAKVCLDVTTIWTNFATTEFDHLESYEGESFVNIQLDESHANTIEMVKFVLSDCKITAENIHELWLKNMIDGGWKYGIYENKFSKTHPDMLPFQTISSVRRYDYFLFVSIVRSLESVRYEKEL